MKELWKKVRLIFRRKPKMVCFRQKKGGEVYINLSQETIVSVNDSLEKDLDGDVSYTYIKTKDGEIPLRQTSVKVYGTAKEVASKLGFKIKDEL